MSRNKTGKKNNRAEANRVFQASLKLNKKLRRERRQAHGVMTLRERASHEFPLPDAEDVLDTAKTEVGPDVVDSFGDCPTQKEWDEMHDRAKRRKRGFQKFAESNGWKLVGENFKEKDHWEIER